MNRHMYGADSAEYKAAIENVDDNLGAIMAEIEKREALGEELERDRGDRPRHGGSAHVVGPQPWLPITG